MTRLPAVRPRRAARGAAGMAKDVLVFVGTFTEPIRFGTGKILEGKGEGI